MADVGAKLANPLAARAIDCTDSWAAAMDAPGDRRLCNQIPRRAPPVSALLLRRTALACISQISVLTFLDSLARKEALSGKQNARRPIVFDQLTAAATIFLRRAASGSLRDAHGLLT